ncbi:hypothetical protein QZH41_000832 [Actinostola sp. cb2023]|nr:hypothetical protein QZH41_000832 [Actinostola sp. cb2023]
MKLGALNHEAGNFDIAINHCEKAAIIARERGDWKAEVESYVCIGQSCCALIQYEKATEYFNQCLTIAQEINFKRGEMMSYGGLGTVSKMLGNYDEAIRLQEKCLQVAIDLDDKRSISCAYGDLGTLYQELGNYKKAIMVQEKRLQVATELADKFTIGRAYGDLGTLHSSLCEDDQAMDYFQRALDIAIETGDKTLEGIASGKIGLTYHLFDKDDKAIEYLEKQVNVAKQLGCKREEASGCFHLGMTYSKNDPLKAIDHCQKALAIYEATNDRRGEAQVYKYLGEFSESLGKYKEAFRCYNKALDIAVAIQDKEVEFETSSKLGSLHQALGKPKEAIAYMTKCLELEEKILNKERQKTTFQNIGSTYYLLGKMQLAAEYFEKQQNLAVETNDKLHECSSYTSLGRVFCHEGQCTDAMMYFNKSLKIAVTIGNKACEVDAHLAMGRCYFLVKNYDEALKNYDKALIVAKATSNKVLESFANSCLGLLYFELATADTDPDRQTSTQENYKQVEMYLKEAIQGSDWHFHHLQDLDRFKISIFNQFIPMYNILTATLIETCQIEEALLVCERGRGRALSDLLISKYYISHQDAAALESPLLSYDDVQAVLLRSKLCALFYTMAHKYVIWVLDYDKPISYHISQIEGLEPTDESHPGTSCSNNGISPEQVHKVHLHVAKLVQDAYLKMNVTVNRTEQVQQHSRHPLEILFDVLIAPVQSQLSQEEIVIIPEGPLYLVPFAALKDPKTGLYLSETKRIRLAPSLVSLKTLQECPADYHSKSGALVIGNPKVGKVMFKGEECEIDPLPSAESEIKYVSYRLGVTALTGSQATKEEFKKRLAKGAAVIHIAAHGDPSNGEIVLAPSDSAKQKGIPEEDDYLLTMKEVQEIGVRAQLVVLSCCHSGRGQIEPEGVVGMSRAFLAAGARAVIASLWTIDDYVTLSFMVSLYSNLKMGHSASKSLQQAMEDIRKEGRTEPKYWAPFYLIGDDVTISV